MVQLDPNGLDSLVAESELYQLALDGLATKVASREITETEYESICLEKCDLNQVMEEAKNMDLGRREKSRIFHRMLNCFRRMVAPLERYSTGIDTMVQANSVACLVWGAMKTILLVAHDLHDNFEVIADGLQEISDSLPNHQAYNTIVVAEPQNPLRPPLIRIYVETLTYSILSVRYLRSGVFSIVGKAILRSEVHGFKKCMEEIKKQSSNVNSLAIGDIWQNSNATMEDLQEAVKALKAYLSLQPSRQLSNDSSTSTTIKSNIPSLLSSTFVAREKDLDWIASAFWPDKDVNGLRRAAIYGMTGIGKTQLALKYEERNRALYDYRLWVTSGAYAKVRSSVQQILDILDIPERARSEPHVQDAAFRTWLENTAGWLLIFDNVNEEDYKAVLALLPQEAPKGDILFTSQRPGAMDKLTGNLQTRCLRLEELDVEDSVQLFCLAGNIERTEATEPQAREIVKSNGYLPQAINQAASYVKNTDINLSGYLKQFELNAKKLLDYKNAWDDRLAVSAHMQISLESLKTSNRNALNLLKLFSYFEPESIPWVREWRRNDDVQLEPTKSSGAGCLPWFSCFGSGKSKTDIPNQRIGRVNSDFQASTQSIHMVLKTDANFDHALLQLRDFSLVKVLQEGHQLWMHDLTRYVIRQSIPVGETTSWLCLALEVLFHTFPEKDGTVEERAIVDIYLPQAESLITQARNAGIPLQKYAKLIVICGVCFHDRCSYSKSLQMFQIARPVYQKYLGLKNEKTLTLLHRIGWSYRELSDLARSEEFFSQTLAARRKLLPPDSLDLFVSMTDLASVIERQGRLKEAEVLFEKCYESQKLALGPSSQRTLAAAHNLALCFANQGRLQAAIGLCRKTLSLSVSSYGADDPGTLRTASNLAVFIDHQGRFDEALPMYQESLTRYKKRYGYDHILTMRIRSNLAAAWRVAGQFEKAEFMLREVLSELIRLLGPDHFHVCVANFDLAEILHEAGKVEEAQERYQLAIAIFQSTDPGHPVLFRMVDGLGILYREVGNLISAATMTDQAYNDNMKLLKWYDPYTLVSAVSRAEVCQLDGRSDEAQQLLEKCLESFTKLLGPDHPHVLMTRNSLGCLELRKGRVDKAMQHLTIAKTGYVAVLGAQHSCVMIVQMNIGRIHIELEEYDLAVQCIEHSKDRLTSALGKKHPHVAVAEFYQGLIAACQGDLRRALNHYIISIELYTLTLGRMHPNSIRAAMELLKVQAQLPEESDESAVWAELVEKATPILHEIGSMRSIASWSASDGLFWGESSRLRWGRKSVWRGEDEGLLTG